MLPAPLCAGTAIPCCPAPDATMRTTPDRASCERGHPLLSHSSILRLGVHRVRLPKDRRRRVFFRVRNLRDAGGGDATSFSARRSRLRCAVPGLSLDVRSGGPTRRFHDASSSRADAHICASSSVRWDICALFFLLFSLGACPRLSSGSPSYTSLSLRDCARGPLVMRMPETEASGAVGLCPIMLICSIHRYSFFSHLHGNVPHTCAVMTRLTLLEHNHGTFEQACA